MKQLERIRELVNQSILDTKEELEIDFLASIKKDVDRISKLAKKKGKREIYNIGNYEMFKLYFSLDNYDLPFFGRSIALLERYKDVINAWTYDKEGRIIFDIIKNDLTEDIKLSELMEKMKLVGLDSLEFRDYSMTMSFHAIFTYLKYKAEVKYYTRIIDSIVYMDSGTMDEIREKTFDHVHMYRIVEGAVQCISDEIKSDEKYRENMHNRLKFSKEVLECMDDGDLLKILVVPDDWHRYLHSSILEELYDIVHHNLHKRYREMVYEEKEINGRINENELRKYLFSKKLDYYSLSEDVRDRLNSVEDIVKKIKYLEDLGIDINLILTKYVDFLIEYDNEKIKFIDSLIKINALSKKTLCDNLLIILDRYEMIKVNFKILKDIIDFNNMFYSDTVLFLDSHKLRNILSVLKEYNLTKNNYMFLLCNFEFIDIYDLMLEHQISLELFISICHTGEPVEVIKRIIVFKSIGEEYETVTHRLKKDVILNSKFDDDVSEYIDNIIPYLVVDKIDGNRIDNVLKSDIVKYLDSNYRRGDIYVIGNVRISRNKFLRNYQKTGKTNSVLACLLSNSIMDSGEYAKLYKTLHDETILTKQK